MKDMTKNNLADALAGESQAHLRYHVYAAQAEREGLANVARLFRAASFSEQLHASVHLRTLEGNTKTMQNLESALAGETFEINEMYPAYLNVAGLQEEPKAVRSMEHALAAEKVHAELYARAKEKVAAGGDLALDKVHVCEVCGFTMEGDAPDRCPVCGALHTRFVEF